MSKFSQVDVIADATWGLAGLDPSTARLNLAPDGSDGFAGLLEGPAARVDLAPDVSDAFAGLLEGPAK